MAIKRTRKRSPAPGYSIEVNVEGCDKNVVDRVLEIAMKAALIQAREIPQEEQAEEKQPFGCTGA